VPKADFARLDWYDTWYPELAPSAETMKLGQAAQAAGDAADAAAWAAFGKRYRAEMAEPAAARTLDLLATLSHAANFSVGCYCEREDRCHRGLLRGLLAERGAALAG